MTMIDLPRLVVAMAIAATFVPAARAQEREKEPIGRFVADFRASFPRFPEDAAAATAIGVAADNVPGRGLGLSAGVHVYPFRLGKVAIGFGGEWLNTRASKTAEPATEGGPDGPTVNTRFSALSPQISVNFGSRRGWSYLTGGLGRAAFTTEREDDPVADAGSKPRVLNYGGGARWFAKEHLAFTFDLRWYRIDPQDAVTGRPAYGGRRVFVASAGISVK
jgi:hypothetical protein